MALVEVSIRYRPTSTSNPAGLKAFLAAPTITILKDRLVSLTPDAKIDRRVYTTRNLSLFDEAAFCIYLIGQLSLISQMYGDHSLRFATIETGLMTQLLEMTAPASQIGLCQIGSLDFDQIRHLFTLEESHILLHSLVGGAVNEEDRKLSGFVRGAREYRFALESLQGDSTNGGNSDSVTSISPSGAAALQRQNIEKQFVSDLQDYLKEKLPEYMVPSSIMIMDSLPLTSNGKVNRNALPDPGVILSEASVEYAPPQTEIERSIAGILESVLKVEKVGIRHNFYDLGANSLHLVQIYAKLRQLIKRDFPLVKIFEHPTISALAKYLSTEEAGQPSIDQAYNRGGKRKEAARQKRAKREKPAESQ